MVQVFLFDYFFLHQVYYPLFSFYLGCLVIGYFLFLRSKCLKFSFLYYCKEYVVTLDTLSPFTYIPERLGLSFLISISLGFSILVLLSDKLADEIYLDFLLILLCLLFQFFG